MAKPRGIVRDIREVLDSTALVLGYAMLAATVLAFVFSVFADG